MPHNQTGIYAATVCDNHTVGIYDDWYLPSWYELSEMYNNKDLINTVALANGGSAFFDLAYWSSS